MLVFSSRFLGGEHHRVLYFWHSVGNRFLTLLSNMFTNLDLTDMECGYKVLVRQILERITIEENRFGFEPEVVAKVARLRCRVYEVGISYSGRTYEQGKKIRWTDGLRALWCIAKYSLGRAADGPAKPQSENNSGRQGMLDSGVEGFSRRVLRQSKDIPAADARQAPGPRDEQKA